MKKGKEIVLKIQDYQQLEPYLAETYNKIVVLNAYEKFWGPVEIIDFLIRRIIDEPESGDKIVFLSVDRNICPDLFGKFHFTSKPAYFILHRGTVIDSVDGLDFPVLTNKIEKSLELV